MNPAKNALVRTQKFVVDHKVAIAVTTTAAVGVVINRRTVRVYNAFLEQKGLLDEFLNTPAV